ncbi:hypothetical protein [Rhodococcus sp. IEGM 1307]|nr:hypothetical protein [Rhodococcus sp. IEGM 1307]MDI9974356.1 hypothetical protein [Rhodococcus sp. IEGM 1307]
MSSTRNAARGVLDRPRRFSAVGSPDRFEETKLPLQDSAGTRSAS